MVSTHLKNISQNWNLPQIGVKIKNLWNHHLVPEILICCQKNGGFYTSPIGVRLKLQHSKSTQKPLKIDESPGLRNQFIDFFGVVQFLETHFTYLFVTNFGSLPASKMGDAIFLGGWLLCDTPPLSITGDSSSKANPPGPSHGWKGSGIQNGKRPKHQNFLSRKKTA